MAITFRPISIAIASEHEALLVLNDESALAGVLVRLGETYDVSALPGSWFLEAGFGRYEGRGEVFATIEDAENWFRSRANDDEW